MTSIDFPTVMTHVFVLVDDWFQENVTGVMPVHRGVQARFSDSEVITLALLMDYLPFPGETQFISFIRANYLDWFPKLLNVSQFNRRLRQLSHWLEPLRRSWVLKLLSGDEHHFCMDTKPVPILGVKRSQHHSNFSGSAAYGYCAARRLYYFGYKLTLLSTTNGIPVAFDLVPANTDDRKAVMSLMETVHQSCIFADKGFIGYEWQAQVKRETKNQILTPQYRTQTSLSSPQQRWRNSVRQRIEGVFHELQNTGRSLERLLNKTVDGLVAHVSLKVASHSLRLLLRRHFQIDVLTFSSL